MLVVVVAVMVTAVATQYIPAGIRRWELEERGVGWNGRYHHVCGDNVCNWPKTRWLTTNAASGIQLQPITWKYCQ